MTEVIVFSCEVYTELISLRYNLPPAFGVAVTGFALQLSLLKHRDRRDACAVHSIAIVVTHVQCTAFDDAL